MSKVQELGSAMMRRHGFLGVPEQTFEVGGRAQLIRLLEHGLAPEDTVLEIGCGPLRVAYWLVRFLDPDRYCGIEPARLRVAAGREFLFTDEIWHHKRPRFDHNAEFDTSGFGQRFDYFLAGSIWTHCSKGHIETTLDGFLRHTTDDGVFLTSYLPASSPADDYMGTTWVGTSHESTTPGVICHALDWVEAQCHKRDLTMTRLPGLDCDSQWWLHIAKS